ncbi:hypothetical protein KGQ25_02525 [Patescibacteria group bacterium]|nr:hypothetical protein [Patescibacteria group bacterium]MDE2021535.1 hypothetical protein [Patescibacteria group bacterium]MDE2173289.1 hypothetical protein [Patescibacteria group bacterium]
MPSGVIFEWEGREHNRNPKSADWYWVLGIVGAAIVVALVLFGDYLVAVMVVVAAIALALHAAKHPPLHRFRLVEQGLLIGDELHPFSRMLSFSVLEDIDGELPPLLSIKNESWLSPHLLVPLEGVDAETVYAYFLHHVDEGEHTHTLNDLVAAWLGF